MYAREGEDEITRSIPRKKWVQVEATHNAANNIQKALRKKFSGSAAEYISVGVTTNNSLHHSGKVITVDVHRVNKNTHTSVQSEDSKENGTISIEKVRQTVPHSVSARPAMAKMVDKFGKSSEDLAWEVEGIPVRVTSKQIFQEDCHGDYYDNKFRPIPGGVRIEHEDDLGTTGMKATDSSNNDIMLSAGHVVKGGDWAQPHDENNPNVLFKENIATNDYWDAGYFSSSCDLETGVAGTHATYGVSGYLTNDTLRYHEGDQDFEIHKQGKSTKVSSGHIYNVKNYGDTVVLDNVDTWGGDSGGPYYKAVDSVEELHMVGVHSWGSGSTCPRHRAGGNTIESIEQKLNVSLSTD